MAPRVFVSHKQEDSERAALIAARLRMGGLDVYLDVIDVQLDKGGPDLADYIRMRLEECSQLLAVISPITRVSWWVPWEIGVATEKERFLASFVSGGAPVPEYLRKWPYLQSISDFDKYIDESNNALILVENYRQRGYGTSAKSLGFRSFHSSLKASLGQR